MTSLIARLRRLVGDDPEVDFTDDALQEALDAFQSRYVDQLLTPLPPYPPYREYEAGVGGWADNEVLERPLGTVVVPDSADRINGRWTFDAGLDPNVYISGQTYDVYAAAVLVIEWALGKGAGAVRSWSADGVSISKDKAADLERLHRLYTGRTGTGGGEGGVRSVRMRRRDVLPNV